MGIWSIKVMVMLKFSEDGALCELVSWAGSAGCGWRGWVEGFSCRKEKSRSSHVVRDGLHSHTTKLCPPLFAECLPWC